MRMLAAALGVVIMICGFIVLVIAGVTSEKSAMWASFLLVVSLCIMVGGFLLSKWGFSSAPSPQRVHSDASLNSGSVYDIDISKLSAAGYLLFLACGLSVVVMAILVASSGNAIGRGERKMYGLLGLGVVAAIFYGGRFALTSMGYSIFKQPTKKRKKKKSSTQQGLPPKTRRPKNPHDPW